MTPPECKNGTERAYAALQLLDQTYDCVVNLQGDAALTPPWILEAVVQELEHVPSVQIATPAVRLSGKAFHEFAETKKRGSSSGTLVVTDHENNALYFSKALIPFVRSDMKDGFSGDGNTLRHIGLYGYRKEALEHYMTLPPGPVESIEKLEQLRALEHGMKIRVVEVSYRGRTHGSVDNPEDVSFVEGVIDSEGELLQSFALKEGG
jgi:3-deoxy-manno-octulosonate cytidylyltransferase (CMP-KDO synthetase)